MGKIKQSTKKKLMALLEYLEEDDRTANDIRAHLKLNYASFTCLIIEASTQFPIYEYKVEKKTYYGMLEA